MVSVIKCNGQIVIYFFMFMTYIDVRTKKYRITKNKNIYYFKIKMT